MLKTPAIQWDFETICDMPLAIQLQKRQIRSMFKKWNRTWQLDDSIDLFDGYLMADLDHFEKRKRYMNIGNICNTM